MHQTLRFPNTQKKRGKKSSRLSLPDDHITPRKFNHLSSLLHSKSCHRRCSSPSQFSPRATEWHCAGPYDVHTTKRGGNKRKEKNQKKPSWGKQNTYTLIHKRICFALLEGIHRAKHTTKKTPLHSHTMQLFRAIWKDISFFARWKGKGTILFFCEMKRKMINHQKKNKQSKRWSVVVEVKSERFTKDQQLADTKCETYWAPDKSPVLT